MPASQDLSEQQEAILSGHVKAQLRGAGMQNAEGHKNVPDGSTVPSQHANWLRPECWSIVDSLHGQKARPEAGLSHSAEDSTWMKKYSMVACRNGTLPAPFPDESRAHRHTPAQEEKIACRRH